MVDLFQKIAAVPSSPKRKLFLTAAFVLIHRKTTFSQLGSNVHGPLGGYAQTREEFSSRRRSEGLCKNIFLLNRLMNLVELRITNKDWSEVVRDPSPAFLYCDPPYFNTPYRLYRHNFAEADHVRLADGLRGTKHPWLLSYDDHPKIRELYNWAFIKSVKTTYTIGKRRPANELLIMPYSHRERWWVHRYEALRRKHDEQ